MTTPTRRERLRPVELLAISAIVAVFVGLVVLMSTRQPELAAIFLCIAFIVVVVVMAMLQLAATSDQDDNDMLGGNRKDQGDDFH
jgi:Flp pilus assembly protein TadB